MLESITPLLLTYNEAPNLGHTLAKLGWAKEIVVVDSGSTDETLAILARNPKVRVYTKVFETAATQCNFGLEQIKTPWVLSLDADYELSDNIITEMSKLQPSEENSGYRAFFIYRVFGTRLPGTLYPPRVVLYRLERAKYYDEGHTQRVQITGLVLPLRGPIYHDDRKPLSRWLTSQQQYARREAVYLLESDAGTLRFVDRLRLMAWPAPLLVFFYTLFWKRCFFGGRAGWFYVLQRTLAEIMLALEIIDRRASGRISAREVPTADRTAGSLTP